MSAQQLRSRQWSLWRGSVVILMCLAVGFSGAAHATSVVAFDAREMVAKSPAIVHGTVVSTASRWNADHSLIVTETRLRVQTTLKGQLGGEVVVLQPGGTVGKLQVEVPGATPFRVGEETVLFLVDDARGNHYVQGLSQGRFEVVEDRLSGQKVVRGGILQSVMGDGAKPGATAAGAGDSSPVELDAFFGRVRTEIQAVEATEGQR